MNPKGTFDRLVLLNRLVSTSRSRAPAEHQPPIHSGIELLQVLADRRNAGSAVEYINAEEDADEAKRKANGAGRSLVRLSKLNVIEVGGYTYATLLFEYVNQDARSFSVVHTSTFEGRDISGEDEERGATAAHVVIRLPAEGYYDDGTYRCAVEVAPSLSRRDIETFFSRQLKRQGYLSPWTFGVVVHEKGKKPKSKDYKYRPRLQFYADIGRRLDAPAGEGRTLSHMIFVKRAERVNTGQATDIDNREVIADVELKINAKQGPEDSAQKRSWFTAVRRAYEDRGYQTKLYYRYPQGNVLGGDVHRAVAVLRTF